MTPNREPLDGPRSPLAMAIGMVLLFAVAMGVGALSHLTWLSAGSRALPRGILATLAIVLVLYVVRIVRRARAPSSSGALTALHAEVEALTAPKSPPPVADDEVERPENAEPENAEPDEEERRDGEAS